MPTITLRSHGPARSRARRRTSADATAEGRCPACGERLAPGERAVSLHGDRYHADCALYQPRRSG